MKKSLLIVILSLLVCVSSWAQDESKEKSESVGASFENGTLIDAQTNYIPAVKSLEFVIQHKFGTMDNGVSDLYGLYAPGANVRLGLNYVPVKNLQIGAGITKTKMYTDLNAKWTILEQTQNDKVPVFVMVYGNVAIDGRSKDDMGRRLNNYGAPRDTFDVKFNDRYTYFAQLMVGRKFSDRISLQAGVSFSHANLVDQWHDHDRVGLHFNGRVKFSPQSSFIVTYDAPLKIQDISEQNPDWTSDNTPGWDGPYHPKATLAFGVEISTYTHAFQIYVSNATGILPQQNMMNNINEPFKGLSLGFTITRLWMY